MIQIITYDSLGVSLQELRLKLRPIVFVALSGASKACMCRVLQVT